MPSDLYRLVGLSEVMDIQGGAQPPANTFIDYLAEGYVRFVQIRDFESDAHKTYIKSLPKWKYCTKDDVLIARYGASVGRICRGVEGAYNVALAKVIPKKDIDLEYLYQLLRSRFFQEPLSGVSGRSAQAGFNKSDLSAIHVPLPDPRNQKRIGDFLGHLDRRIALLRATNQTLEAISQAIFKSWFIDFDPVRAKMEGRAPVGMNEETAALFPDELVESELGLVPKGWEIKTVDDVVETVGGATPDTKNADYWEAAEHYWTSPKDLSGLNDPVLLITERRISTGGLSKISSGLLPVGSLLMSSRAPIGYLAISDMPVAINQGYIAMLPGGRLSPLYMLRWCQANMEIIKGRANGSTFMEISKKAFRPIPILLPNSELLDLFEEICCSLFERLVLNAKQAQTLSELRDSLLPRLISGKLRLADAMAEAG
jgi:type I restriction enzyme S subunit